MAGDDNAYTAEFWEYDSRTGRRWNRDPKPLTEESEYATNKDNPIKYNDPNGDCPPGSPCAEINAKVSYRFGTVQNRIGLSLGGSFGVGGTVTGGNISMFRNFSGWGPKGGSNEVQVSGFITQGFGGSFKPLSSNTSHAPLGSEMTGRNNSLSLYTTIFKTNNGTSQRVGGIGGTFGRVSLRFEDDYLPFISNKYDERGWPITGDGEDRFRTAAVKGEVRLDNFSVIAGFKLITGDPRLYGKNSSVHGPRFSGSYNSIGNFSQGELFGGIGRNGSETLFGVESDEIRYDIIYGVHNAIKSPYQPRLNGVKQPIRPFIEHGTTDEASIY